MWIRSRTVIIEDEPLASKYLSELVDETCQVGMILNRRALLSNHSMLIPHFVQPHSWPANDNRKGFQRPQKVERPVFEMPGC